MTKRLVCVSAVLAAGLTVAGWASKNGPGAAGDSATSELTASTSSTSTSSASASSAVTSSASAGSSSVGSASASASLSVVDICTAADIRTTISRGSGASQTQFATIRFVNRGTGACHLEGFPTVALLASGAPIGSVEHSDTAPSLVTLVVGASATADLTVYSSCNAPSSDTVRVGGPGLTTSVDLPLVLRGCRSVVEPVKAG